MSANGSSAPSYDVPHERIVSIEHPCIVKNFSNGFQSLGGEHQLKHVSEVECNYSKNNPLKLMQVLEHEIQTGRALNPKHVNPVAGVSLRPDDPFAKKLSSTASTTQNVLIRVTVPKRTGRKRKRGSDDPFTDSSDLSSHSDSITAPELLQRLRDNEHSYSVQAVGIIQDTHRFPDLPDFQVCASDIPIMRELRNHAMEPNYGTLKAFNMNFESDVNGTTSFPGPPSFLRSAGQMEFVESKELRLQKPKPSKPPPDPSRRESAYAGKTFMEQSISLETNDVPQGPSESLTKQMGGLVKPAIDALEEVFKARPIVSVRAFDCLEPGHTRNSLRAAIPHVGYYMNSGPWAHCIAKYGIDPRKDPAMRKYQTVRISYKGMSTASIPEERRRERSKAHIFDGSGLAIVSGIWQLCDLADSTLQHIVNTDQIRSDSELEQWGWYHNGTAAKIRVILRDKMLRLVNAEAALPEEDYMAIARLPNIITDTVGYGVSVYENNRDLQAMCSAIAKDAVYRDRDASAADKKSMTSGDAGRASAEPSERVEGVEYYQKGDDEDYAED